MSSKFNILKTTTIAAILVFASFIAGQVITMMMFGHRENRQIAMAVNPNPSPSLSPVQTITEKAEVAEAVASPTPASPEVVKAIVSPTPVSPVLAPRSPAVKHTTPKPTKHRHIPLIATETKDAAVKRASAPWDDKEKVIDNQLSNLDRRIAAAPDAQKQALTKRKESLMQRKNYVRRSRQYSKDAARVAWDKAHGTSAAWDQLMSNLGL